MDITRSVDLKSDPSTPDGVFSRGKTDNGFEFVTVEKPWLNDQPDKSCLPRPKRYWAVWEYSNAHGRYLYHVYGDDTRHGVEWHAANVHEQLLGCFAPGKEKALFKKDSIHPGMPSRDMWGVDASGPTLEAFHKAMQDENGNQMPFWLNIA